MNRASAKKIIDTTIELCGKQFSGIEVSLHGSNVATSRFAECQMTQNQSPEEHRLSLRVISDKRQIRMETDDTSLNGLKDLIESAATAVKFSEPDQSLMDVYAPDLPLSESDNNSKFDKNVRRMGAQERAAHVGNIIEVATKHDLNCAGIVANGTKFEALGNSSGHFCYHEESHFECSVTMVADDSTGWAKGQSPHANDVDALALGNKAALKAISARNPQDVKPGRYTAILEPSAVLDLLGYLLWDFSATSHRDKQSCLLNKVGEKVFDEHINISDDVAHHKQSGADFDAEGVARKSIKLIDKGKLSNLVYGRRSANQSGESPTGHGLPEPSLMGEYPMNLVMSGGKASLEEMIEGTEDGILLTRVWYVRTVDPARKILTGMSRDGTYRVLGGKIDHAVKNLRFNISLLDLLNQVETLGVPVRAAGEESLPGVVPAMKVSEFNFTEVTRF